MQEGSKKEHSDKMSLWFGQVNAFLKVLDRRESARGTAAKDEVSAYMQYLYDIPNTDVSQGAVSKVLRGDGLWWAREALHEDPDLLK